LRTGLPGVLQIARAGGAPGCASVPKPKQTVDGAAWDELFAQVSKLPSI
jgi:hypothetical protein